MTLNTSNLPIDISFKKMERVSQELTHYHDGIELINVIKGRYTCKTNKDSFLLNKGDLCFINQRQLHCLKEESVERNECLVLTIGMDMILRTGDIFEKYIYPIVNDASLSHLRFYAEDKMSKEISKIMYEMYDIVNKKIPAHELKVISLVHEIFFHLYLSFKEDRKEELVADSNIILLRKIIDYIKNHYSENIKLEDLAKSVYISPSKCTRLFKEYTNESPINYLINYRLEKGAELLRTTDLPISSIAQEVGFSEQSYFTRMFLKEYQVTPFKYRNEKIKSVNVLENI